MQPQQPYDPRQVPPVQPQQPAPQPYNPYASQPTAQPQYDFILNPAPVQQPSAFTNISFGKRLLYVFGGFAVLLIAITLIGKALSGGSGGADSLLVVAQQQQYLLNLTQNAQQSQAIDAPTQDIVATTEASMTSAQQQTIGYMQKNGIKVKAKSLEVNDTTTEKTLASALAASTYQTSFNDALSKRLITYKQSLTTAFKHIKGPAGRELLQNQYKGAELIQKQLTGR